MKILFLILASDDHPFYVQLQDRWRKNMEGKNVDYYFVKSNPNQQAELEIVGHTMTFKYKECYQTIWFKTFSCFKYLYDKVDEYDYIFRPNLSSFIDVEQYIKYVSILPKTKVYSGVVGSFQSKKDNFNFDFASGCGFTITPDVLKHIVDSCKEKIPYIEVDDVTIGYILRDYKIIEAPRVTLSEPDDFFKIFLYPNQFHYRIKTNNDLNKRQIDLLVHDVLLSRSNFRNIKLGHVLTAVDTNPEYVKFIPLFIKAWKSFFPCTPITILLISKELPQDLKPFEEHIKLFEPIEGIKTSYQAQNIRLYYPALLDCKQGVLITDIDMVPMNREYYNSIQFNKESFVVMRDVLEDQYPICYSVASSKVWGDIFKIKTIEDVIDKLKQNYQPDALKKGEKNWFIDQIILKKEVDEWNKTTNRLIKIQDHQTKFVRLCRDEIVRNGGLTYFMADLLKSNAFCDFHLLHGDNLHTNEKILNMAIHYHDKL